MPAKYPIGHIGDTAICIGYDDLPPAFFKAYVEQVVDMVDIDLHLCGDITVIFNGLESVLIKGRNRKMYALESLFELMEEELEEVLENRPLTGPELDALGNLHELLSTHEQRIRNLLNKLKGEPARSRTLSVRHRKRLQNGGNDG
jgi:hypothetical protein